MRCCRQMQRPGRSVALASRCQRRLKWARLRVRLPVVRTSSLWGITTGKLEEISRGNVESTGQLTNVFQGDVALPPLDLPNKAPVEVTLKGELFLGQT